MSDEEDEQAYRARLQATKALANKYKGDKQALNKIKDKAKKGVAADQAHEDDEAHRTALEKAEMFASQADVTKVREKVKEDIKADLPPPPGLDEEYDNRSNRSSVSSTGNNHNSSNRKAVRVASSMSISTPVMPPPGLTISAAVTLPPPGLPEAPRRSSAIPPELVPDHLKSALAQAPPKPPPPPSATVQKIHKHRTSVDLPDPTKVDFRKSSAQYLVPLKIATEPPPAPPPPQPQPPVVVAAPPPASSSSSSPPTQRRKSQMSDNPTLPPRRKSVSVVSIPTDEAHKRRSSRAVAPVSTHISHAEHLALLEAERKAVEEEQRAFRKAFEEEARKLAELLDMPSRPPLNVTATATTTTTSTTPTPSPPTTITQPSPPPPPAKKAPREPRKPKGYIIDPLPTRRNDYAQVLTDLITWRRPIDFILWLGLVAIPFITMSLQFSFVTVIFIYLLLRVSTIRGFYGFVPRLIRDRIVDSRIGELTVGDLNVVVEALHHVAGWIRPPNGIVFETATTFDWVICFTTLMLLGLARIPVGVILIVGGLACMVIPGLYVRRPRLVIRLLPARFARALGQIIGGVSLSEVLVDYEMSDVIGGGGGVEDDEEEEMADHHDSINTTDLLKVDKWIELTTAEGRAYWFNPATSETKWKLFDDDVDDGQHTSSQHQQQQPEAPPVLRIAVMMYNFKPGKNPQEIAGLIGDELDIYEEGADGWVTCRNTRTGLIGLCPQNYLKPVNR